MRVPRVYIDKAIVLQQALQLEERSSHHVVRVLRMEVGRELLLFNGQGGEYLADITAIDKKRVTVIPKQFNPEDRESPLHITLAMALCRSDRMDWAIQKATELGVQHVIPLLTEYTEVKLTAEREKKKLAHWRQIALSACEQSQRNRVPILSSPVTLQTWFSQDDSAAKLILHHENYTAFTFSPQTPSSVSLLIGPEGGFSDREVDEARQQHYQALTLGPRVLRTETAPVVAITMAQLQWGDFLGDNPGP